MKKIREGKTKTLYEAEGGNILLHFKDDVTGTGDVIDPGANAVIGKVEGKGNASLKLSQYFFEKLEQEGILTHYVKADIAENKMLVRKAEPFGEGLEFICRLKATGSFMRRYGKYAQEGQPLDYLVEITLKDDDRGDPAAGEQPVEVDHGIECVGRALEREGNARADGVVAHVAREGSLGPGCPGWMRIFADSVISMQIAQNIVVIKTISGSANAAAETIDAFKWEEIVGTLAGDNTIFIVSPDADSAKALIERFKVYLH